jgi:phospholipid transport system substrate-binding protein
VATSQYPIASIVVSGLHRRSLFGMVATALVPLSRRSFAGTAAPGEGIATIQQFNAALLAAMKAGGGTDFSRRFEALAPAVDRTFDLPTQQAQLLDAFRRYTVASYVASFDNYTGQSFTVSPDTRSLDADRTLVKSRISPVNGDAIELDYVMEQTPSGWKVVDVLAAGSISRVAVQRSDFRHLLSNGGGDALLASLRRKTADLSGGTLA